MIDSNDQFPSSIADSAVSDHVMVIMNALWYVGGNIPERLFTIQIFSSSQTGL